MRYPSTAEEHVFGSSTEALAAIPLYRERLYSLARKTDQEHSDEFLILRPVVTIYTPLVLLGGMGPLAGVNGFDSACRRFLDSKQILLFQACTIPDRTQAVKDSLRNDPSSFAMLAERLESAISQAVLHLTGDDDPIDLIVLCNTSHFFLAETLKQLSRHSPGIGSRVRHISLIKCALKAIKEKGYQRIMALYTEGARLSHIYADPFKEAGLFYLEADGNLKHLEDWLMTAIYSVKAFDEARIVDAGTHLFNELMKIEAKFDCIVAGCTEIPFIIERLKAESSRSINEFLSRTEVIDPVSAALQSI